MLHSYVTQTVSSPFNTHPPVQHAHPVVCLEHVLVQPFLAAKMVRWTQLGTNTVCSTGTNSGDVFSGAYGSMPNPDDCPKLCLTKPKCAYATHFAGSFDQCYLYSASKCTQPKNDGLYGGISWKRTIASTTTTPSTTTGADTGIRCVLHYLV